MKLNENPTLTQAVDSTTALKEWLVNYVGEQQEPENGEVTVEMIVNTIADEFPEFLLVVAEENWVRGYHQAMIDVETLERKAIQDAQENTDNNETDEG